MELFAAAWNVLTSPRDVWQNLDEDASWGPMLGFAALMGALTGLLSSLLVPSFLGASSVSSAGVLSSIIGGAIQNVIGVFLGAVVLLVVSAICGGRADYKLAAMVCAWSSALDPLVPLCLFAGKAGLVLLALLSLYSIYVVGTGLIDAMDAQPGRLVVLGVVFMGLLVLAGAGAAVLWKKAQDQQASAALAADSLANAKRLALQQRMHDLEKPPEPTPAPAPAPTRTPPAAAEPAPAPAPAAQGWQVTLTSVPPGARIYRESSPSPLGVTPAKLTFPTTERAVAVKLVLGTAEQKRILTADGQPNLVVLFPTAAAASRR